MLTLREFATLRAALWYWEDEMSPHDVSFMSPYFDVPDADPLSAAEIQELRTLLSPAAIRFVRFDPSAQQLGDTQLFETPLAAYDIYGGDMPLATVLLPQTPPNRAPATDP